MAHAWIQKSAGNLEKLKLREIPLPDPEAGQARVRVEYCGLNLADVFAVLEQDEHCGAHQSNPPLTTARNARKFFERSVIHDEPEASCWVERAGNTPRTTGQLARKTVQGACRQPEANW